MTVAEIAKKYCLDKNDIACFDEYIENKFTSSEKTLDVDMSFIDLWTDICSYAAANGVDAALNECVIPSQPVCFVDTDGLGLEIYDSFAGRIPVIYIKNTQDFENFITNAVCKGVPPDNLSQMGASFISGKATRFIVLSAKPYSNVPASEIGISSEEWAEKSMIIRREHECTHYYTKQFYGTARNNLHDELIADFFGMYEAFGEYRAELFLKFMGIGEKSGRLGIYTKGMSTRLLAAISEVATQASAYLEKYSKTTDFLDKNREERVNALCRMGLGDMCLKA